VAHKHDGGTTRSDTILGGAMGGSVTAMTRRMGISVVMALVYRSNFESLHIM